MRPTRAWAIGLAVTALFWTGSPALAAPPVTAPQPAAAVEQVEDPVVVEKGWVTPQELRREIQANEEALARLQGQEGWLFKLNWTALYESIALLEAEQGGRQEAPEQRLQRQKEHLHTLEALRSVWNTIEYRQLRGLALREELRDLLNTSLGQGLEHMSSI